MTRGALYEKHRGIALGEARDWRIPGLDPDDVRQECQVTLWCATATWDPARGRFASYARHAVKARCVDLLRAATRQKRTADIDPDGLEHAASPVQLELLVEQRDQLRRAVDGEWSPEERRRRQWRESKRRAAAKRAA